MITKAPGIPIVADKGVVQLSMTPVIHMPWPVSKSLMQGAITEGSSLRTDFAKIVKTQDQRRRIGRQRKDEDCSAVPPAFDLTGCRISKQESQ